ncbi:MAG TPA: ABC transporter ATP-binding protein [Caldisericia bacterium]|nr:ABC transporter ATP-binding protein [Caldisericia bacterium]
MNSIVNSSKSPEIRIQNVSKIYERGTEEVYAVDNVSLTIDPGSFVCLVGASGSGKSTLLHMIGCLDQPSKGKLFLNEFQIPRSEAKRIAIRRNNFGFIFQQFLLIPTLNVEENILLPLTFSGRIPRKGAMQDILKLVSLEHRRRHRPSQLSGGEMQRVAIARALMNDPLILIADEPTGNLDSKNSQQVFELFQELNTITGMTIICATHNLELASMASRVLRLKDGVLEGN